MGLGNIFTSDLNTAIKTGYYGLNTSLYKNANSPVVYGGLIVFSVNRDLWIFQLAFNTGGEIYTRSRDDNSNWSSWIRLNN